MFTLFCFYNKNSILYLKIKQGLKKALLFLFFSDNNYVEISSEPIIYFTSHKLNIRIDNPNLTQKHFKLKKEGNNEIV